MSPKAPVEMRRRPTTCLKSRALPQAVHILPARPRMEQCVAEGNALLARRQGVVAGPSHVGEESDHPHPAPGLFPENFPWNLRSTNNGGRVVLAGLRHGSPGGSDSVHRCRGPERRSTPLRIPEGGLQKSRERRNRETAHRGDLLAEPPRRLKPSMGRAARLVRCSTIGIPGAEEDRVYRPRRVGRIIDIQRVDADQDGPPWSRRYSAAAFVKNGWPSKVVVRPANGDPRPVLTSTSATRDVERREVCPVNRTTSRYRLPVQPSR